MQSKKTKPAKKKKVSQQEIIDFLIQNAPQTFKAKDLAQQLNISRIAYQKFRNIIKLLVSEGKVIRFKQGRFGLAKATSEVLGELHVKTQGYGFLRREDGGEDVFVSMKNMAMALHRDFVRVQLLAHSSGESPEGIVTEVIKRARSQIVGTFRRGKRTGFVVPDDLKIMRDIYVTDKNALGAKNKQKVVVEIRDWEHLELEGIIIEILGFADEPGVAVDSVVHSHELPVKFPSKVLREIDQISDKIDPVEIERRLDLREEMIITIDPADSKDFDDAVSLKQLENGNWQLGVHIADVSYYVRSDSNLEREALKRGTSVYLVDRVIPMLPEKLSNQICSLQPQKERLTFSALIELSEKAEVINSSFHESVIRSQRRFTYQEVQAIIDGQTQDETYAPVLLQMHQLSQKLIRRRLRAGSLDLDIPEAQITLNDQGVPIEIKPSERLDSHRLIEDFMLLANQAVARHVALDLNQKDQKFPFVYRIHEKPTSEKIQKFIDFVTALGYEMTEQQGRHPKLLQKFISGIPKEHDRKLVNKILLRSLMKAQYATQNVGHFGLAFKHYTHFTSPIRRYPDMLVHRILKQYLAGEPAKDPVSMQSNLDKQCKIVSEREVRALGAERESIKLKQVEFIEQYIGEVFDGVVSGVVPFGLFVEIPRFLIDGLVHVNDLEPDFYVLNDKRYSLTGQNTGKVYRLGDPVQIRVARVNREEKIVDFTLAVTYRKRKKKKS